MEENLNNWRGDQHGKEGRGRLEVYEEGVLYGNINTSKNNNKDIVTNTNNQDNNDINTIKLSNVYFAGPITLNNLSNPSLPSLQLISQTTYRSSQQVYGRYKDRIGVWPRTASICSMWFGKVVGQCMVCVCAVLDLFGVRVPSYSEFRYKKEIKKEKEM